MNKPKFDPSKPYQAADPGKPKFDPSQPYEAADSGAAVAPQETNQGPEEQTAFSRIKDAVSDFSPKRLVEGFQQDDAPSVGEYVPIVGGMVRGAATSKEGEERLNQRDRDYAKNYPEANFAKSMMGSVMFPAGAAIKGASMLPKIGSHVMNKTVAAGTARAGLQAAETGLVAGADAMTRGAGGEGSMEAAKEGGKYGFALGMLPVGLAAAGRTAAATVGGVKPGVMNRYRERADTINELHEPQMIREVSEDMGKVKAHADERKLDATERATAKYDRNKAAFQQKKRGIGVEYEAGMGAHNAEIDQLKQMRNADVMSRKEAEVGRVKGLQERNQSEAKNLQRAASDEILEKMGQARGEISKGSGEAFKTLPRETNIPLAPFKSMLTKAQNKKKIGESPSELPGMELLEQQKGRLDRITRKEVDKDGLEKYVRARTVSPQEAKKLIQEIDQKAQALWDQSENSAAFMSSGGRSLLAMRAAADRKLKKLYPEYAEAMKPVAAKASALSAVQKKFPAKPDAMYSAIGNIDDVSKLDRRRALENFDTTFDSNVTAKAKTAAELRRKKVEADPAEVGRIREMQNEDIGAYFTDRVDGLRQKKVSATDDAAARALERKRAIDRQKAGHLKEAATYGDAVKGMSRKGIVPQMLRTGNQPEKYQADIDQLSALGELSGRGKDYYPEMAKDYSVKQSLRTTRPRGSAGVNLMHFSLSGLGKMLGVSMQKQGGMEAAGALIGSASDLLGPKTVKAIIDVVDSPAGKFAGRAYSEAAKRGSNAFAVTHNMLMKSDPEYRDAFNFYNSQEDAE